MAPGDSIKFFSKVKAKDTAVCLLQPTCLMPSMNSGSPHSLPKALAYYVSLAKMIK